MKICSSKNIRPVIILLFIFFLSSCKGSVFNFPVIDDASNKPLPQSGITGEGMAGKSPGLHFALTEDGEGLLSVEVRNNGEKSLSMVKLKIMLYGIRESGLEGFIREDIIGGIKEILPGETQKFRYDARQEMDRLTKAEGRIECSECGELDQAMLAKKLYPAWAGIKPDLSMGLADDNDGTVMVQLKNQGRMAVTGVRLKITACCNRRAGNKEELYNDEITGAINPSELFIKVYKLKALIKGLDLSEIVRVAYSVSCEECVGIEKENTFSAPVEMMFIRGGDLPFGALPHEVDETNKHK